MSPTSEPLIYTTKGNLPVASLRYATQWFDDADTTVFVEEYFDGDESVKRSVHVYSKRGLTADGTAAALPA